MPTAVIASLPPGHPADSGRGSAAGERRAALAGGAARPSPQLGVGEPRPERGTEGRRVLGRNQNSGPDSVGAVPERLGQPADVGCDHRQAAGQRLGDDHAVALGARRQHQHVRGGVAALEVDSGPRSREANPVADPADQCAATETVGKRRVTVQAATHRSATTDPQSSPARRAARHFTVGVTAATQSSSRPAADPTARSAASTPGWATWTRSAGNA